MKSADTLTLPAHNPATLLTRLAEPLLRMHATVSNTVATRRQRERNDANIGAGGDSGKYTLFEAGQHDRAQIEAFIHHNYAKNFGAHIEAFMPRLFGLRDSNGTLCGAFGLRTTSGKLFLEQYLQSAIESEIGARCGRAIARAGIVEVGHFSGAFPGAARAMIYLLTLRLRAENFAWVSFTGTRALRNAFQRMGL
ncbi:MAG TPA: thermostable hemolysin, partial [Spongiibacteraceae bacterium]|nr:thermostable hemolysin [Spongiibacteraceae bacterium]